MFTRRPEKRLKCTCQRRAVYFALILSPLLWKTRAVHSPRLVTVVVPSRSVPQWGSIGDASLHSTLLPSLEKTTRQDRVRFTVDVLVVVDEGDSFWEHASNQIALIEPYKSLHGFNLIVISVRRTTGRIPMNEGCRFAYNAGAEYIVRINDDTEFLTDNWLTLGVSTLKSFVPSNFGVVGPTCGQGKTSILTHDMVHRTHLHIFDDYYPPVFDAWWIDDWISMVYGPRNTVKLTNWEVHHHMHKYGQRYKENRTQQKLLPAALIEGKQRLLDYLIQGSSAYPSNLMTQTERIRVLTTSKT